MNFPKWVVVFILVAPVFLANFMWQGVIPAPYSLKTGWFVVLGLIFVLGFGLGEFFWAWHSMVRPRAIAMAVSAVLVSAAEVTLAYHFIVPPVITPPGSTFWYFGTEIASMAGALAMLFSLAGNRFPTLRQVWRRARRPIPVRLPSMG